MSGTGFTTELYTIFFVYAEEKITYQKVGLIVAMKVFVPIFVELDNSLSEKVIDWDVCSSSLEGIHSCGAWPSKPGHDLIPSLTRLGSGLKVCMLSSTWNCPICKYRAPYTSLGCTPRGGCSQKFVVFFCSCIWALVNNAVCKPGYVVSSCRIVR